MKKPCLFLSDNDKIRDLNALNTDSFIGSHEKTCLFLSNNDKIRALNTDSFIGSNEKTLSFPVK